MADFTVEYYIMEFFKSHPNQELHTSAVTEYVRKYKPGADVSTRVNDLSHEGKLSHVGHGLYKYVPSTSSF